MAIGERSRRITARAVFAFCLMALAGMLLLLRFSVVTDTMYHALVKDPERSPPPGRVIVAPADGRVLYVKRVDGGVVPDMVKRGVAVPLHTHLKTDAEVSFATGTLVGIYMSSDSVHVNRVPISGLVKERIIFNGPHMDMSAAERTIILTQLVPGLVSFKKALGITPYDIADQADFILKSARETLVLEDLRGTRVYIARIADYAVGKILTWVREGERVEIGQKLGMITWGSQTDIFFEDSPGIGIEVEVGDFVYAGESILATY